MPYEPAAILWGDSKNGIALTGRMTLSRDLPAGLTVQIMAVPRPLRSKTKEKYDFYVDLPLDEPLPEPPELNDIFPEGMIMPGPPNSWFKPPEASKRRNKILIYGAPGTGKSLAALSFPKASYIDNHGSVEKYQIAYPDHRFASLVRPDDTMAAVAELLQFPGDRCTCVLDDMTVFWERLQAKWEKLFLSRLPSSKGHHAEFYTFQPSDWQFPKRELRTLVRRLLLLDMNVIVIARAAKEYAGEGGEFMKVIGETFSGEKNLPYEFDYVFQFVQAGNTRLARTTFKQRQTPGVPLFPSEFEFHIDPQGRCDFYQIFSKLEGYRPEDWETTAHAVEDPEKGETFPSEASATQPLTQAESDVVLGAAPQIKAPGNGNGNENGNPKMVTKEQLDQMVALKAKLLISKESWSDSLKKYDVSSAKEMSFEQAESFINHLNDIPF